MEFLKGGSLRALLKKEGKLAVGHALRLTRQIASALAAAHKKGIVHREQYAPSTNAVRAFQRRLAATDGRGKQFDGVTERPSATAPRITTSPTVP